jgi:hypothetical protein
MGHKRKIKLHYSLIILVFIKVMYQLMWLMLLFSDTKLYQDRASSGINEIT